jgi:hypothetical protein
LPLRCEVCGKFIPYGYKEEDVIIEHVRDFGSTIVFNDIENFHDEYINIFTHKKCKQR